MRIQHVFTAGVTAGVVIWLLQYFIEVTREPHQDYSEEDPGVDPLFLEHLDTPDCWCQPVMVYQADNGTEVWVHKGNGEEMAPSWIIAEAIADAIAGRCE